MKRLRRLHFDDPRNNRVPEFKRANHEGLRRYLEMISWSQLEGEGKMKWIKQVKDIRSGFSQGESVKSALRRIYIFL